MPIKQKVLTKMIFMMFIACGGGGGKAHASVTSSNFPVHSPLLLLLLLSCFVFFILPLIIPVNINKKSTWHNPPGISWAKPCLGSVGLRRSIPWCSSAFLGKFPCGLSQTRVLPGRNMPAVVFCLIHVTWTCRRILKIKGFREMDLFL